MRLLHTVGTTLAIVAISAGACKSTDDKNKQPQEAKTGKVTTSAKQTGDTPTIKAPTPSKAAEIKIDDDVMNAIKAVVKSCKIDLKEVGVKCSNGEAKRLSEMYGYTKPKSRVKTIGTLAVALNSAEPKLRTVAAWLLSSKFSYAWGKDAKAGSVAPEVATTMLKALRKLGKEQGLRAIAAITHASTLAKQEVALFKALDTSPDRYLKRKGYQTSMFYGRMRAFDKVSELAKSKNVSDKLAAMVGVNSMPAYNAAEKAKICPWALKQGAFDADDDNRSSVFEYTGYIVTACRGVWIDKLLDFGLAQLKKNKFNRQYYFAYRGICFSIARALLKEPGAKAQCNRNYEFLEKVVNSRKIKPEYRGLALDAISYQRRDATSLRLMKKYKNHKVAEIRKRANEAIKMLQSYVKKK